MLWSVIKIKSCLGHDAEQLSDMCLEQGAVSVTLTDEYDNPVLEPLPGTTPLWPSVIVTALFSKQAEARKCIAFLAQTNPNLSVEEGELEDADWERAWMDNFKPMEFGRLWVVPSWLTPPKPDAINLILDPGLAFGTGNHPTTALCLNWLGHANLENQAVIDYGCGSGILAIAACKLGARVVNAVDIDSQAITATLQNANTNEIPPSKLVVGLVDTIPLQGDILIANILLEPLIHLKDVFKKALTAKGTLVVSGLLTEQVSLLKNAYEGLFELNLHEKMDDWSLLVFTPKPT